MHKEVERFIERAGVLWEKEGFPRIAGRIFGLALLSEDPLSLDELAESLGVSRASISTDTRLLERMGLLERVTKPGDRKDYYQSTERSFERAIAERVRRMHDFEALVESGRAIPGTSAVVRERLADHHFAYSHITRALETALRGLEAKHRRKARS